MSQTKAQLIQPIGVVTASGVVVSGVMTAGTFDGDIVGSATSIIQGTNLNLGAFNATSFAGDFTGNATGIITSSAIKVGQLTASSFVGDFTGTATSMMRGTGFEAGAVTGGSFVADVTGNVTGNATGLAGSVTQGTNIHVGVVTATSLYGDGSNLTGIAATNYNTQTVTANSATTTIDLSAGNVITFNQSANTTVSLANTSESMAVTLIRDKDNNSTPRTITWPSSIMWDGGTAPTLLTDAGSDRVIQQFQFLTRDSGVTWYGWETYKNETINHSLFVWGVNQTGELGQNQAGPWNFPAGAWSYSRSSPTQVPGTTWSKLATTTGEGNHNTVIKSDGTLWAWGNNTNTGALGQNDNVQYSSPVQVGTETTWATAGPLAVGTMATKTDGTLWSWGYNQQGQIGNSNNNVNQSSPVQIPGTNWSTGAYALGAMSYVAGAIKTDGTLWMWGRQQHNGELGQNNLTNRNSPVQVGTETTWRSLGGAYSGVLATKTDGTLWSWGNNIKGHLGHNDIVWKSSPTQVGTDTTWSEVTSYGGWQSVGVMKTDGTLWKWGSNEAGEAGQNSVNNGYSSPVQVPGTTWKDYDGGNDGSAVALKTDGTLWAWGYNNKGILGLNQADGSNLSSPTQIGTATNWYSVCANDNVTFALRS